MFTGGNIVDKQHAAMALGGIGPDAETAFAILLDACNDQDEHEYVRGCAAEALRQIDSDRAATAGVN
jgi:HEAT repeat protein